MVVRSNLTRGATVRCWQQNSLFSTDVVEMYCGSSIDNFDTSLNTKIF